MGQNASAPAVVNVGLPGGGSGGGNANNNNLSIWSQESDDNKTRMVSEPGGFFGVSGVSRLLQPSSTRLILGGAGVGTARSDGPDGWCVCVCAWMLRECGCVRARMHMRPA